MRWKCGADVLSRRAGPVRVEYAGTKLVCCTAVSVRLRHGEVDCVGVLRVDVLIVQPLLVWRQ